jgi:hypothetical protein
MSEQTTSSLRNISSKRNQVREPVGNTSRLQTHDPKSRQATQVMSRGAVARASSQLGIMRYNPNAATFLPVPSFEAIARVLLLAVHRRLWQRDPFADTSTRLNDRLAAGLNRLTYQPYTAMYTSLVKLNCLDPSKINDWPINRPIFELTQSICKNCARHIV